MVVFFVPGLLTLLVGRWTLVLGGPLFVVGLTFRLLFSVFSFSIVSCLHFLYTRATHAATSVVVAMPAAIMVFLGVNHSLIASDQVFE
jgi:hypothetical protein